MRGCAAAIPDSMITPECRNYSRHLHGLPGIVQCYLALGRKNGCFLRTPNPGAIWAIEPVCSGKSKGGRTKTDAAASIHVVETG